MIIVRTPLRISFFGGGTDFPDYFLTEGGCVLSTAIDKYVFVTIRKRFDEKLRIGYTRTELVDQVDEVQHELIREALRITGIQQGVEITTMSDIPAGTGLGSSSAITVGALHAMHAYRHELVTLDQLAQEACSVEINHLGKPIGVQDQYICAHGGLRFIEFQSNGCVTCNRINLPHSAFTRLNESLLLFFTGVVRSADKILDEQQTQIRRNLEILREMKQIAYVARKEVDQGNIEELGRLLDESWQLKKRLASRISNGSIEEIYQAARQAGALGGKITGAGGGGFLLLLCPPGQREAVRQALLDLRELPVRLEPGGSKVILDIDGHVYG